MIKNKQQLIWDISNYKHRIIKLNDNTYHISEHFILVNNDKAIIWANFTKKQLTNLLNAAIDQYGILEEEED